MDITSALSLLMNSGWAGAWLFFLLNLIESAPVIGSFMPSGTILYIGGLLASKGALSLTKLIVFAAVGAAIGDHGVYLLGRWGRDWIEKNSWIKEKGLIRPGHVEMGEAFFRKHGDKSILIGRFTGPVRAAIPFSAGTANMRQWRFFWWNLISNAVWTAIYAVLGFYSGNFVLTYIRQWSNSLEILGAAAIILWITYRFIRHLLIKKHGAKPVF